MPRLSDIPANKPQSLSFTSVSMPPAIEVRIDSKTLKPAAPARRSGVKLTEVRIRRAVEGQYAHVCPHSTEASTNCSGVR